MLKLGKAQLEAVNGGCRRVDADAPGHRVLRKLRRVRRQNPGDAQR